MGAILKRERLHGRFNPVSNKSCLTFCNAAGPWISSLSQPVLLVIRVEDVAVLHTCPRLRHHRLHGIAPGRVVGGLLVRDGGLLRAVDFHQDEMGGVGVVLEDVEAGDAKWLFVAAQTYGMIREFLLNFGCRVVIHLPYHGILCHCRKSEICRLTDAIVKVNPCLPNRIPRVWMNCAVTKFTVAGSCSHKSGFPPDRFTIRGIS